MRGRAAKTVLCALAAAAVLAGPSVGAEPENDGQANQQAGQQADKQAEKQAARPKRAKAVEEPSQYTYPLGLDRGIYELAERPWRWTADAVGSLAARPAGDPLLLTKEQAKVYSAAQVAVDAEYRNWALAHGDELERLRKESQLVDRRLDPAEVEQRREAARRSIESIEAKKPNHDHEVSKLWRALSPDQRVAVVWDLATEDALMAPVAAPANVGTLNPRRVLIQQYLDDISLMSEAHDDHDIETARLPGELGQQLLDADQPTREMALTVIKARFQQQMQALPVNAQLQRERDGGPSAK